MKKPTQHSNKAARQKVVESLLASGTPEAHIKDMCSVNWHVDKVTIGRDIEELRGNNTMAPGKEKPSAFRATVKSIVASTIRTMLTGEAKTKTLRSVKIRNKMQDELCFPSYGDSLNADDRFLKSIMNLSRKANTDSLFRNALELFERWARRYERKKMLQ